MAISHLCDDAEDDGGLVKMFAMVAISDYDCGNTMRNVDFV
jgi:hypothetical protein